MMTFRPAKAALMGLLIVALLSVGLVVSPVVAQSGQIEVLEEVVIDVIALGAVVSPDGERIAVLTGNQVCIWTPRGERQVCAVLSRETPNAFNLLATNIDSGSLVFSPDGKYLAFTEDFYRRLLEPDIYLMDTTTGQITALTGDTDTRYRPGANANYASLDIMPTFSPDGQSVYFVRNTTTNGKVNPPLLCKIPITGGVATKLAELALIPISVLSMDWLPGGKQIVMAVFSPSAKEPTAGIYLINADGTGGKNIYQISGYADVRPSADGKFLMAFNARIQGEFATRFEMATSFIHNLDGTLAAPISPDLGARWAAFAPEGAAIAYIAREKDTLNLAGLYIAEAAGAPGRRIYEAPVIAPGNARGTQYRALQWAKNGVMVISGAELKPIVLRLGVKL